MWWGGDALCCCVALVLCTLSPSSQGDASVPSPHPHHSRPYKCDDLHQKTCPSQKHPTPRPGAPSPPEIQMDGASNEANPKYKLFHRSTRQGHGPQGPRYAILPPTTYSRVNPAGTHSRAAIAAFRARQGKPPP